MIIIIYENKRFSQIIGNPDAPFLNHLAVEGALFTQSFAQTHPSQGNYLALFSGHTHGVDNSVPAAGSPYAEPNLGSELLAAGFSFIGYSEDLPFVGFAGGTSGHYRRRHNPWVNYSTIPNEVNRPFTDFPPPEQFGTLPTVSFVIPNLKNDMHDGSIATGDAWTSAHLGPYVVWARSNNSLLIVTFDEDDFHAGNHIATIFVGPMVRPGRYDRAITHYAVLRTIEDAFGLPPSGHAAEVGPIDWIWVKPESLPSTPASPETPAQPRNEPETGCGWLGLEFLALLFHRRLRCRKNPMTSGRLRY